MSVAKLSPSGAPNVMKSEDGNDSLDAFIRQAIGKEPLLSFSRTGDSPVQWIQLLHALDKQDLPGWPLLTPMKVQMQKCEKCSREFCSSINYRRHMRMHRRSLNVDKESHKNRDLLGAFWDKLSLEEAKEIASLDNVSLKEVSGSSVVNELASSLAKPGVWALPQVYVKAGSILLDIIQAKSFRLPISSQELFSILDDASERTFLCAGTAESVQKYVFIGEAEKALELKNLVACASLLFEQNLVKAWLANKDAEALKCQKLLVEEEEAAKKRLAQLLEKKKQKKLWLKEQKEREQLNGEKMDISDDHVDGSDSAEFRVPRLLANSKSNGAQSPGDTATCLVETQLSSNEYDKDLEAQNGNSRDYLDMDFVPNVESLVGLANGHGQYNRWQTPKSHRLGRNGFHGNQHLQVFKQLQPVQKQSSPNGRSSLTNGGKVWTKRSEVEKDEDGSRSKLQHIATDQMDKNNCELMIGSISVPVISSSGQRPDSSQRELSVGSAEQVVPHKNILSEKIIKSEAARCETKQAAAKLWRPVCQSEPRESLSVERGNHDSEESVTLGEVEDRTSLDEICLQSCAANMDKSNSRNQCLLVSAGNQQQPQGLLFSGAAAKAFLAERWKEAIAADHTKLIFSPEAEPAGHPDNQKDPGVSIKAEYRLSGVGVLVSCSNENAKARLRMQPGKGVTKVNYIPKQKIVT